VVSLSPGNRYTLSVWLPTSQIVLMQGFRWTDAINLHPSAIRAKLRQEFERNKDIDDLQTMDVLLLKSHQEYQVGATADLR
jgi:hypothetical protein